MRIVCVAAAFLRLYFEVSWSRQVRECKWYLSTFPDLVIWAQALSRHLLFFIFPVTLRGMLKRSFFNFWYLQRVAIQFHPDGGIVSFANEKLFRMA